MKCRQILFLALSDMATASLAFTPARNRPVVRDSIFMPRKNTKGRISVSSFPTSCHTALKVSEGASADEFERQLGGIQDKANKLIPKFLLVDVKKARIDLEKKWGWLIASGACTMGLGTAAFVAPMIATVVAYDATVLTVAFTGLVNLTNLLFGEWGQKLKYGVSSALYLVLAYVMATHPAIGLNAITLSIASLLATEGAYEIAVAMKNKSLQSRPWHFVSGIISILASVALTVNIPLTSLFTPGAALGARLTSSGATKVVIGMAGKDLADANKRDK